MKNPYSSRVIIAAVLIILDKETFIMVLQSYPLGMKLSSYANTLFCTWLFNGKVMLKIFGVSKDEELCSVN